MRNRLAAIALLLGLSLSLPATAQLQYFGYVGGADDDLGLNLVKGFTNFAYIGTSPDLSSTFVLTRVNAMAAKGQKAVIDLSVLLWCDYDANLSYRWLCSGWDSRWATWKANNAAILTADKVLAFTILDEPFNRGANMMEYEAAAQKVKADFPWAKTLFVEAACVIDGTCAPNWPSPGLARYAGSLPGIDWLGLDGYGIHPGTDQAYQAARSTMKSRFPGRKWIYVMDGYWDPNVQGRSFVNLSDMGPIADEWYNVASSDPDAVLLGVFSWPVAPDWTTSQQFTCDILAHHVAIGRSITHKVRPQTALPVGSFSVDYNGLISGWACDPDGTLCELPGVDIYSGGAPLGSVNYLSTQDAVWTNQCSSGVAYRFTRLLNVGQSGRQVTAVARDLDSGSASLPNSCPNSVCVWYSQFYAPQGYLDNVDGTGHAYGWVCDRDAPQTSSQVRLVAGGTMVGLYPTDLGNEQAVTTQCGGGTLHRFSVALPAWTRGQQITALAENLGSAYAVGEVQIPVLCPNGFCQWR